MMAPVTWPQWNIIIQRQINGQLYHHVWVQEEVMQVLKNKFGKYCSLLEQNLIYFPAQELFYHHHIHHHYFEYMGNGRKYGSDISRMGRIFYFLNGSHTSYSIWCKKWIIVESLMLWSGKERGKWQNAYCDITMHISLFWHHHQILWASLWIWIAYTFSGSVPRLHQGGTHDKYYRYMKHLWINLLQYYLEMFQYK